MTLKSLLEFTLIKTEKISLTVYQVVVFVLILVLTWLVLRIIQKLINRRMKKKHLDVGSMYAIFQIIKYFIWIIAIGIALETVGIKFNLLIASSAALLVGIGFGLQQIFSDYISGILILFEGNLKVNDVVELDNMIGKVKHIGLRTSKVETRDNYIVIVPNRHFINGNIVNWSHIETNTRFHINVGVAYGSDVRLVEKVLLNCAHVAKDISNYPKPFVRFNDFGNSSLDFQLYFWVNESFTVENVKSELRFAIDQAFRENSITIPFPQHDLHIKTDNTKS